MPLTAEFHQTDLGRPERPIDEWSLSFGPRWRRDLAIMAAVVFLFGAIRPLADPDLPMHLAMGEWIVRHRQFPHVEPFAWTATGQPYFAYSWLFQVMYFGILAAFGPLGLHGLQGLMVLGVAVAPLAIADAARWRPSLGVMLGGCNLIVGAFFVAMLRPQAILLITIPLLWAATLRISRGEPSRWSFVSVFLASALTANAHLFFPLTAAPLILFWIHRRGELRFAFMTAAVLFAGWFATPYALSWPAVFRHNFAAHILYRPPAAITELQPGFVVALMPPGPLLIMIGAMLAVPWLLSQTSLGSRERIFAAVYWSFGLLLFGYAVRLFLVWWVLAILPAGWALRALTLHTEEAPPRMRIRLFGLAACLCIIALELVRTRDLRAMEGNVANRVLPTTFARAAEPAALWLATRTLPASSGRILTSFAFGSYLTWRLPKYSASIDSRGTVPDSVAAAEAIVSASERDLPIGPWQSADLAILPVHFRAAGVLDTASGWHRLASFPGEPIVGDSVGLWVRQLWWAENSRLVAKP